MWIIKMRPKKREEIRKPSAWLEWEARKIRILSKPYLWKEFNEEHISKKHFEHFVSCENENEAYLIVIQFQRAYKKA